MAVACTSLGLLFSSIYAHNMAAKNKATQSSARAPSRLRRTRALPRALPLKDSCHHLLRSRERRVIVKRRMKQRRKVDAETLAQMLRPLCLLCLSRTLPEDPRALYGRASGCRGPPWLHKPRLQLASNLLTRFP